eukprot:TRINITY_DN279_c0_g1_i6.p1 TRINITY_DN279_c0_g1~~TRINITY_DN279_c0_g1_i6.p1  ORF type:complete len:160 (-),score=35.78 TRINITY_DN279_c0_g1_i6:225-704(-)
MAATRRSPLLLVLAACVGVGVWMDGGSGFVSSPKPHQRSQVTARQSGSPKPVGNPKGVAFPVGNLKGDAPYGKVAALDTSKYGIRTGLSDLLKPLNSQIGVVVPDSVPTLLVLFTGIVALFLFYVLLLMINNQSVLLPPEDEFDEYVANFFPYFFFGEK